MCDNTSGVVMDLNRPTEELQAHVANIAVETDVGKSSLGNLIPLNTQKKVTEQ